MLTSAVEFKGHRQCFLQPALPGRVSRPQRLTTCANSKPVPPAKTPQSQTSSPPLERSNSKHVSSAPALQVPRKRLSRAQIIAERFSDTAYDVYLHYARLAKLRTDTRKSQTAGQKVVVLGSGWGAHSLIKVIDLDQFESVTMLSPRNYFFFTPLLSSTAVGTTEFRSIVEPIRHANPLIEFYEGYAIDVDLDRQVVRCRSGQREGYPLPGCDDFDLPYDTLVIAVGETTSTFGVAGAREHAYFLKEIPDARRLRVAIIDALERASLPVWTDEKRRTMLHFVIVGGGPTGCEFAGELADFVGADLSSKYEKDVISMIQVTLLQSGDSLLTQFEESLQKMAVSNFHSRVNIEFNARVVSVNANTLELADGRTIDYGLLVWAAGNATRPIVAKIIEKVTGVQKEEATKKRRKLTVDPWLRVKGAKNVFALGDCATIDGESLPATAQVAGQQGAYIGRLVSKAININGKDAPVLRDAEDKEVSPFHFLSLGAMAYLGNDRAVVQVDASDSRQLAFGGRIAFFLWRSVYAVKQVDVRNRVLVLFDWFKARAFGRDISQF